MFEVEIGLLFIFGTMFGVAKSLKFVYPELYHISCLVDAFVADFAHFRDWCAPRGEFNGFLSFFDLLYFVTPRSFKKDKMCSGRDRSKRLSSDVFLFCYSPCWV